MFKPTFKISALALAAAFTLPAHAAFDIALSYTGLTAVQQSYFAAAESFWETVITGYQGTVSFTQLSINATGAYIDGVGSILGSAGPTAGSNSSLGYLMASAGSMTFDTADIDFLITEGSFSDVIRHEMAHVIGFGTLWDAGANSVYTYNSGQFTGAAALAEYKTEYSQPAATFVPIELDGGLGTANGHWNENANGFGNTGIADGQGRDMQHELMTGWLNSPAYVSRTTIASFQDIGYTVNVNAVPEANAVWLGMICLPLLGLVARRRRQPA